MPGLCSFQYALRNGGSVPSCCVTSYCSRVSRLRSSSSEGFVKVVIAAPSCAWDGEGAGGAAVARPCAAAAARQAAAITARVLLRVPELIAITSVLQRLDAPERRRAPPDRPCGASPAPPPCSPHGPGRIGGGGEPAVLVPVRPRRHARRQRLPARARLERGARGRGNRALGLADPSPDRDERRAAREHAPARDGPRALRGADRAAAQGTRRGLPAPRLGRAALARSPGAARGAH